MLSLMTTHTAPQQLLSPAEVADALGIPLGTVRCWIRDGKDLPPMAKIGHRIYFRRRDVEAWLDSKFEQQVQEVAR